MRLTIGFYVDSVPITPDVLSGACSLGGSESACLGLARALKAKGHDVQILATKLDPDCYGPDQAGVRWQPAEGIVEISNFTDWDVFCVLRMFPIFGAHRIPAKLRLLWNQDLLMVPPALMSIMWAVDRMVYVSEYQRQQYEERLPELKGLAYVTRNGFDPSLVPTNVTKDPNRIIHISRPERGLGPLLAMWPRLRARHPATTLQICRYSSMYDMQGWGQICAQFDAEVQRVNDQVGGIAYLGELNKPDLYRAIAESAVMWYPGVKDFAETGCIAAAESQGCGTPFVGSFKGALPETVPSGALIHGDAESPDYQAQSLDAVCEALDGCARQSRDYRDAQREGREHARAYTFEVLATEWDGWLQETFRARFKANKIGVLRQLLHEDDCVAAKQLAGGILAQGLQCATPDQVGEAYFADELCRRVIAGEEQGPEDYGERAVKDVEVEMENEGTRGRMGIVLPHFAGCKDVLDVACGNGSFALLLAQKYPEIRVVGVDYSEANVVRARAMAEKLGLADRVRFEQLSVWDFERQAPPTDSHLGWALPLGPDAAGIELVDGMFVGEFLEHVAACDKAIDHLEQFVADGAVILYTVPHGPFVELLPRTIPLLRGHVHHFGWGDLHEVFGAKRDVSVDYLHVGPTNRGNASGHWMIRYRKAEGRPARPRDVEQRILTTRPMPRLSVGLIARNAGLDLARCLDSIWAIADEIVLGDTGSTDDTIAIAERYGARILRLGSIADQDEGFAGARNRVLATCTGEWFFWIDTDEFLAGSGALGKYLEGGIFKGYAVRQNHLMLDAPMHADTPIRIFRRVPEIRFFGCVHEQPGWQDANTDIHPGLEIHDVAIAHLGYLHEGIRREKMLKRNLPLLQKDRKAFPERRLGGVLVLRDLINLADYDRESVNGAMTATAQAYYHTAIQLFERHFADPADKYHGIARPWYERAVKELGGLEIELALGGKHGGMDGGHAKPKRIWVRDGVELKRFVDHEVAQVCKQIEGESIHVDPFEESGGVP
jgi:glycosyltransferase involved in cell wall biosynthesis/SAM-dependent methyltransferase